eukprot:evm.model.scf_389.4 EVM.evm.TU.scf_389.4   scf_389:39818-50116(-)
MEGYKLEACCSSEERSAGAWLAAGVNGCGAMAVMHMQSQFQYNQELMAFLKEQLGKVENLKKPEKATLESWKRFESNVKMGQRLLARHQRRFDIVEFYKSGSAHKAVEDMCGNIRRLLVMWGMEARVEIHHEIPHALVKKDEKYICDLLNYILKDVDNGIKDDWRPAFEAIKTTQQEKWIHSIRCRGGTLEYLAPETYKGQPNTSASDVFGLGVVMYEVATGKSPYDVDDLGHQYHREATIMYRKMVEVQDPCDIDSEECPPQFKMLMRRCCKQEPAARPKMEDVRKQLEALLHEVLFSGREQSTNFQGTNRHRGMIDVKMNGMKFSDVTANPQMERTIKYRIMAVLEKFIGKVLKRAKVRKPEPGCVVFPVEVDYIDAEAEMQFKDKLHLDVAADLQEDEYLLSCQSTLKVEISCVGTTSKVEELRNKLEHIARVNVENMMYHQGMIDFLKKKAQALLGCEWGLPKGRSEGEWREDLTAIAGLFQDVVDVISAHEHFDICNFHSTHALQSFIHRVCTASASFAVHWNLELDMDGHDSAPPQTWQMDHRRFAGCLRYVLRDAECDLSNFEPGVQQHWESVKADLSLKRKTLEVIPCDDIQCGELIAHDVHECKWKGQKVAMKRAIGAEGLEMEAEELASFYAQVFKNINVDPGSVVRIYGVSTSGAIVMELATGSLMEWAKSHIDSHMGDVHHKMQLMHKASAALQSIHDRGHVYANVKSSKILVFGDDLATCTVKLSGAQPATNQPNIKGSELRWTANELYKGQVSSMESDVFSFGLVLFELVTGEVPYAKGMTEADIMMMKLSGQKPCPITPAVKENWPQDLLKMMNKCCSVEPAERPSMQQLSSYLSTAYGTKETCTRALDNIQNRIASFPNFLFRPEVLLAAGVFVILCGVAYALGQSVVRGIVLASNATAHIMQTVEYTVVRLVHLLPLLLGFWHLFMRSRHPCDLREVHKTMVLLYYMTLAMICCSLLWITLRMEQGANGSVVEFCAVALLSVLNYVVYQLWMRHTLLGYVISTWLQNGVRRSWGNSREAMANVNNSWWALWSIRSQFDERILAQAALSIAPLKWDSGVLGTDVLCELRKDGTACENWCGVHGLEGRVSFDPVGYCMKELYNHMCCEWIGVSNCIFPRLWILESRRNDVRSAVEESMNYTRQPQFQIPSGYNLWYLAAGFMALLELPINVGEISPISRIHCWVIVLMVLCFARVMEVLNSQRTLIKWSGITVIGRWHESVDRFDAVVISLAMLQISGELTVEVGEVNRVKWAMVSNFGFDFMDQIRCALERAERKISVVPTAFSETANSFARAELTELRSKDDHYAAAHDALLLAVRRLVGCAFHFPPSK